jgi:hypothetical protein
LGIRSGKDQKQWRARLLQCHNSAAAFKLQNVPRTTGSKALKTLWRGAKAPKSTRVPGNASTAIPQLLPLTDTSEPLEARALVPSVASGLTALAESPWLNQEVRIMVGSANPEHLEVT